MKSLCTILVAVLLTANTWAQAPEKMSYQAVIRNSNNALVTGKSVGMRISILQGSTDGPALYAEVHTQMTNGNGLVSLEIGSGTAISGALEEIDWTQGPYFIKTETDPEGGTDYSITGITQLLSVPYALHAKTAGSITGTITEKQTIGDVAALDNNLYTQLKNVTDPTEAQDAATKAYADALKETIFDEMLEAGLNGFVKDTEGNSYKTIKIGDQVWMAENLKTRHYSDGTVIPLVTDSAAWTILFTPGYCWYNNDSALFDQTYGALYNWYTIETGKLCPSGWHVPEDSEWITLTAYLGGETTAAGKLRETGTAHWQNPNTGASNESGFTALPGGIRSNGGPFDGIGTYGIWWSATMELYTSSYTLVVSYFNTYLTTAIRQHGFSVRCVKGI